MNKTALHRRARKFHRWIGVILGVQFFFWTMGGLYFAWSDMDEIHGDHQKAHIHPLSGDIILSNPDTVIHQLKMKDTVNFLFDIHLIQILNEPIYQIKYSKYHDRGQKIQLAFASTGKLRGPLTKAEATEIARHHFSEDAQVVSVEYMTTSDGHHEYREQPLPAYAITFDHDSKTTVYVSAELGTVQKFRNQKWRIFDFLWMMHTMDYKTRDNLSNWVLRCFSILGLCTVLSGFILFFISRKKSVKV